MATSDPGPGDRASPRNRLLLVLHDAEWVREVVAAYALPCVANQRCGAWYVRPADTADSAYFKSTDGHHGQWDFLMRRLNLHLLDTIGGNGGCVIVDSTRRGKLMPDALSKTVPLWCAVVNCVAYGAGDLQTPPRAVGPSEHLQMEELVAGLAARAVALGVADAATVRRKLGGKRLRPEWVVRDTPLAPQIPPAETARFHRVVCCTALRCVQDGEVQLSAATHPYTYVQGAADDHELWAGRGVDCGRWWGVVESVGVSGLAPLDSDAMLAAIRAWTPPAPPPALDVSAVGNTGVAVGKISAPCAAPAGYATVVNLAPIAMSGKCIALPLASGKRGSKQLRDELPKLLPRLHTPVLVVCASGTDLCIGVAAAVLASTLPSKDGVRQQLALISAHRPNNPSRATLQAVNQALMPRLRAPAPPACRDPPHA